MMSMNGKLLNVGYKNVVVSDRVVVIMNPGVSAKMRLRKEAKDTSRLIDVTQGRKTRSIVILDSNHVVLSPVQAETLAQRFNSDDT